MDIFVNKSKVYLKTKIQQLKEYGREELEPEQIKDYPIGSLISYLDNNNKFYRGGVIDKIKDDKIKINDEYINLDKIKTAWVGYPANLRGDMISYVEDKKNKTKYPVMIGDKAIYYAKDKFDNMRFCNTDKFEMINAWHQAYYDEKYDQSKMNIRKKLKDRLKKKKTKKVVEI